MDALKSLKIMAKLQAELEKLSQSEENKKIAAIVNDLNEIKNRHSLNAEEFTEILHTIYPKKKRAAAAVAMVKVQVGDKIEEWPASRKGALSGDLKALAAKHKVKTYKELIEKIKYVPSAET
ncbi:TPA: hypothetical protein ACLG1F_002018 [Pseudomonas aeruginosa]|nr:hypothetical protein [Pseudomonas aeruginosa]EMB2226459.1 hypothetical protein [Pseudomonas aeruginosa]EME9723112.1 hypothetical protein [Pseudomonas aeruginosa]MBV5769851.1 hypothetical protein [Pseudomonas aeruginosa]MBV5997905.1 hypothetical protein [Pseudomonas aeruginosa]